VQPADAGLRAQRLRRGEDPEQVDRSGRDGGTVTGKVAGLVAGGGRAGRWLDRVGPVQLGDFRGRTPAQVTTSFATAWADTLSGDYLVLAVGTPAVGALYENACGWANPSALGADSTPFSYILGPSTLPGADVYVNAAGSTTANTQALATDLAYYALNGKLSSGVTTLPAAVGPSGTCEGSPS
jgi:hypothetical protein